MLYELLHEPETWVFVAAGAFLALCVMLVPSDTGVHKDDDEPPPPTFPLF